MKQSIFLLIVSFFFFGCTQKEKQTNNSIKTFCNPINLSYRFCLDEPSRREVADPTMVVFHDKYLLFASKSGGYWYSDDLITWNFLACKTLPVEDYAPTAVAIDDTLYFMSSSHQKNTVYKTTDPLTDNWKIAVDSIETAVWDPALFLDDDKRLYLYWGCSNENPLYGVEIDYKNNFRFIGEKKEILSANTAEHGWEVPGDYNQLKENHPWIEGSWMNKHEGKYYFQYSGPGTEFKSYSDGVFVSDSPLGSFIVAEHNPFSYKPEGYANGAGHGSTFQDKNGNYWHIATSTISVKQIFERRLVLYPTFFDNEGVMHASTRFGDYPYFLPDKKIENGEAIFTGWMLLSYNANVEVSSSIDSLKPSNMTDENIRTYWAAKSGDSSEFACVDLGEIETVRAIQINFAEHNTKILGRQVNIHHRYVLECSDNKNNWTLLEDMSQNNTDNSHVYFQLKNAVETRYVRIRNIEVPDGNFALSGFRIFGNGKGNSPAIPANIEAQRNPDDKRSVKLSWKESEDAVGYNISFGIDKDKLYNNYLVYQNNSIDINCLNAAKTYYFTIEAFNKNGVSGKSEVITVP